MTTATQPPQGAPGHGPADDDHAKEPHRHFDPESYRMTIGDHLEELRTRMFLGLAGFFVVVAVFLVPPVGNRVVATFCRPLVVALEHVHQNTQIVAHEVQETFMVYIKISMISAAAVAGPWLLYQIWQFVAAGLYPHERKYVTKYLPLSIALLISGMAFLYFVVLPLMLEFFLAFNISGAMTFGPTDLQQVEVATTQPALSFPRLLADPPHPTPGTLWYNTAERRLKVCLEAGNLRVLQFGSDMLVTPQITLSSYIDMVLGLLLSFGLAFQMPLIVLAAHKIGVVEISQLKKWRHFVYFGMSVVSAVIVPDVVTGMIALMVPLILLYEFGILLASAGEKKRANDEAAASRD